MTRPIDADAAIDMVKGILDLDKYYHPYAKSRNVPIDEVIDRIEQTPTIDAVPVIRCKDCVYKNEYGYCTLYLNWHHLTGEMDYCSDGEGIEE